MGKGTRVRARRSDGSVAEAYRHGGEVLFGAYFEIQAASGLVAMRFGTAGRSRVVCLTPDDARGYADAFEQGAGYARLDRTEVLPATDYPRPDGDEDAWFEAVDAWGRRQPAWQEATAGTNDPSGVGVAHCHVVLFGIAPSGEPLYVFLAAEDAEALAPLLRHHADEAAEMAEAMQLVGSMAAGMPGIFPDRDQVGQLLAGKPWPPA